MKVSFFRFSILLSCLLFGCEVKQEEEFDYDEMVNNGQDAEWTSGPDPEGKCIAQDAYPAPQEMMIEEPADGSSLLDASSMR